MRKSKMFFLMISALLGSSVLTGCAPLLLGGAVGTTALVTIDRRSTGAQMSDEIMETRVHYEISQALPQQGLHLTVTSYNRRILLTGEVGSESDKQKATKIAQRSLEVSRVVNELQVMPVTSISERMNDSLLASKVRAQLVGTKGVSLNQMKVVVDRGIVYLMGIVTPKESKLAADIAARVSGVKSVVKVFEEMSEEQIRQRMQYLENTSTTPIQNNDVVMMPSNEESPTEVRLQ